MAYKKHNFIKGQKFKAEHANYIEDGIVNNEKAIEGKADLDENGKLKEDQLPDDIVNEEQIAEAVNTALEQAKESGEFDGADGKSAYEYAKDGGYTGEEKDFAEKLAGETPKKLPNPHALTVNGKSYDGSEAVDIVITGGSDGGVIESTLLGQTPYTLAVKDKITLMGSGEHSYTIKGKTVADLNTATVTKTNVTITEKEDYIEMSTSDSVNNWFDAYATVSVDGLTVGTKYVLVVMKIDYADYNTGTPSLYALIKNSKGDTIATLGSGYNGLNEIEFTPDTTSVTINCYVAPNYYWNNNCRTTKISDFYINKVEDGTDRTDIVNRSGTFTDIASLGTLPKGVTITTEPVCNVYSITSESSDDEVSLPLEGKTVVCFGDSLFGMYTGDTSVPAYVAKRTGAIVHNVGFGGCRMSVHPTSGYAEFCMWSLAKAIAEGDWSAQDAAVSKGSANFAEQLAILKEIDFSDVDLIVINYGTNDYNGVDIDNDSNPKDYNTLCGALRYSIETLLTAYPKLRIFVSVPPFRFWTDGDGNKIYPETHRNSKGNSLMEFIEAIAKTAREYNLPVIDSYYGLGINKNNAETFLGDGVHHNLDGRKRLGEYIGSKLISGGDTVFSDGDSEQTGSSVQADLSQNDETAPDYVKGRTHYKDFFPILPETSYTADEDGQVLREVNFKLTVGETYEVFYNRTKYTCVCSFYDDGEITGGFLGNGVILGSEDTGEPFGLLTAEGMLLIDPLDGSTEITLEIKKLMPVKIPTEYYDRVYYVDVVEGEDNTYSTKTTPNDILNALEKDIPIVARVSGKNSGFTVNVFCPLVYVVPQLPSIIHFASIGFTGNRNAVALILEDVDETGEWLTKPYDVISSTETSQANE